MAPSARAASPLGPWHFPGHTGSWFSTGQACSSGLKIKTEPKASSPRRAGGRAFQAQGTKASTSPEGTGCRSSPALRTVRGASRPQQRSQRRGTSDTQGALWRRGPPVSDQQGQAVKPRPPESQRRLSGRTGLCARRSNSQDSGSEGRAHGAEGRLLHRPTVSLLLLLLQTGAGPGGRQHPLPLASSRSMKSASTGRAERGRPRP